ncbi:unnamed protein product, partial [Rotaria magnacalcarata]
YPSSFIDKTFRKFFSDYIPSRSFLPFLGNEAQFIQMRIALSGQPSRQQSQVEMRIATLTTDNEHLIEESDKKQEFTIRENEGLPGHIFLGFIRSFKNSGIFLHVI